MQASSSSKQFRSRSFSQHRRLQLEVTPSSTARSGFRPACSMAEFNKVKQFKRTNRPERYELGQPIRITIPAFFNVPQHEQIVKSRRRLKSPNCTSTSTSKINEAAVVHGQGELYLTGVGMNEAFSAQDTPPALPSATLRKIKDLKIISLAMRRQKNLQEESRSYYCSAVLYDNLAEYRQAIE